VHRSKVVIIGAGPAGIAAAIQLKRYGIKPAVLEQDEIGGLLKNANLVENYPGFPQGISGPDLVELFKEQLENAAIPVSFERVVEIEFTDNVFISRTEQEIYTSNIAVIATGTKPKSVPDISIPGEIKDRIFYEVYPLLGVENKKIAIIGAGDAAFDYALNLSWRNKVTILNKSKQTKCIPVLQERCAKSENVAYLSEVHVNSMARNNSQVVLDCTRLYSQEQMKITADYVIFATGRIPCLDFLGEKLRKILPSLTEEKKFFMIGDVRNGNCRQIAISVGDGLKAAMDIHTEVRRDNK
jgi:thioredoxin reductase (NADPH)